MLLCLGVCNVGFVGSSEANVIKTNDNSVAGSKGKFYNINKGGKCLCVLISACTQIANVDIIYVYLNYALTKICFKTKLCPSILSYTIKHCQCRNGGIVLYYRFHR